MSKPTRLYKCIGFHQEHWPYIFEEQCVRFAKIDDLLKGNDRTEFDHRWDSSSPAFKWLEEYIRPRYEDFYPKTAILSFGMKANKECWSEYCQEKGGVRYEFEFLEPTDGSFDVTNKPVIYREEKNFNLSRFFLEQSTSPQIQKLFKSQKALERLDRFKMWLWTNTQEPYKLTLQHISDEIPFVKLKNFSFEEEYRFVHLTEQVGPKPLKIQLKDRKVNFEKLGLKLVRIATSDVKKVNEKFSNCSIPVVEVDFCD